MSLQSLIVLLLVPACAVYVMWTLMPAGVRRALAVRLLIVKWPQPLAAALIKAAAPSSSCGCSGCDRAPAVPKAGEQTLHFHPRAKS